MGVYMYFRVSLCVCAYTLKCFKYICMTYAHAGRMTENLRKHRVFRHMDSAIERLDELLPSPLL